MSQNAPVANTQGEPAPVEPAPAVTALVANLPAVPSPTALLAAIVAEAQSLREDAKFSHAAHNAEGRRYERLHSYLGILMVVLAAGAGLVSGLATALTGPAANIISSLVAFAAATVAGVMTWLDPKARAREQVAAAIKYANLEGDARRFAEIECLTGRPVMDLRAELDQLVARCKVLDDETPNFSEWATSRASADIDAGRYP